MFKLFIALAGLAFVGKVVMGDDYYCRGPMPKKCRPGETTCVFENQGLDILKKTAKEDNTLPASCSKDKKPGCTEHKGVMSGFGRRRMRRDDAEIQKTYDCVCAATKTKDSTCGCDVSKCKGGSAKLGLSWVVFVSMTMMTMTQ